MIDSPPVLLILALIFLIVWFSYQCEKTRWGAKISAPLIILFLSFALGNLGVLPSKTPVYDAINSVLVPLAIPLLLFSADIKRALTECRAMLGAFTLAVVATIIGAGVALSVLDLGVFEAEIVGVLSASYIGGSANFVATAQAVGFTDSSWYLSTLTADAIGAIFFLGALMLLPTINFISRRFSHASLTEQQQQARPDDAVPRTITEAGVVASLTLSAVICAIGYAIAALIPVEGMFIIAITVLSLLFANFAPQRWRDQLRFDYHAGTIFMYIFFAAIGASADLSVMAASAIPIVGFLAILVIVHIVILVVVGAYFKFSLAELMIASSACILGPSAAAAIAAGQGWRHLVSPGMLVGVLGYAIATFIGISITSTLHAIL